MAKGKPYACDEVKAILRARRAAESQYRKAIRNAQAQCPHPEVLEQAWRRGEYFGSMPAMRVCRRCGYYEYGGYGSYGDGRGWDATGRSHCSFDREPGYKPVLTGSFVMKVPYGDAEQYKVRP